MKGIVIDCRTGDTQEVEDGLPLQPQPYFQPEGLDLSVVAQKIAELDQLKADVEELKTKTP